MNKDYLIPANSKKSMLIFGLFTTSDAILLGTGIGLTILFWMFAPVNEMVWSIISLMPLCITGFLVIPVANYHNVRTILKNAIKFYVAEINGENKFIWKGWCREYEERDKK